MDESEAKQTFMGVTGASEDVAARYLSQYHGDINLAVSVYFADEAGGGSEEEAPATPTPATAAPAAAAAAAAVPAALDAVEAIVGNAREATDGEEEARRWGGGARLGGPSADDDAEAKGKGKGKGKGKSSKVRVVAVLFFADGFAVDEEMEDEEDEEPPAPQAAPKAAPRRTGLVTLSEFSSASSSKGSGGKGAGKMRKPPKLPPLRPYDSADSKAFLAELKAGKVPVDLQKRDEVTGEPIGVSIAVSDLRPRSYEELAKVLKQFEKMNIGDEEEKGGRGAGKAAPPAPALFTGAGHTLSASGSSSAAAAPAASGAAATPGGGPGADPALAALVQGSPAPEVDESKPATTLQVRLASGARVKARLNLDHTVADLWRLIAAQMGGAAAFCAASNHELVAGFPPKPLRDPTVTLAAADLANASVTHRCS